MKLITETYYNPFFAVIGNKTYELNNIHVFNKDGIICSTGRGWFSTSNNMFNEFTMDVELKLKRVIDFSVKHAFIVVSNEKSIFNKTLYELYIPADVIGLKAPTSMKVGRNFMINWKTSIENATFSKFVSVDNHICDVERDIRDLGEKISKSFDISYAKLSTYMEELKKLQKEWEIANEELSKISADEILAKNS